MDKERKNLLVFGYGLAVILSFIAFRVWAHSGNIIVACWLILLSLVMLIQTIVRFEGLKPVYTKWMFVAGLIGAVISSVLLGIIYYLIFTPVAVVIKIMGKDHLDQKVRPGRASYWIDCLEDENPGKYQKQY